MTLADAVALVTGGGRGIGRTIALALSDAGARVAVAARHQDDVDLVATEIVARGGQALALSCDVTEPSSVSAAFARAVATRRRDRISCSEPLPARRSAARHLRDDGRRQDLEREAIV